MVKDKSSSSTRNGAALCVLVPAVLVCSILNAQSQTPEQIATTVVFIEHTQTEIFKVGDQKFEVWLKIPNATNTFRPKLTAKAGTGFLLGYENITYLVTAGHVA